MRKGSFVIAAMTRQPFAVLRFYHVPLGLAATVYDFQISIVIAAVAEDQSVDVRRWQYFDVRRWQPFPVWKYRRGALY